MSDNQEYGSGRSGARGDFNQSANYDPSGNAPGDDNTFSGAHGGSGLGQAGGYGGSGQGGDDISQGQGRQGQQFGQLEQGRQFGQQGQQSGSFGQGQQGQQGSDDNYGGYDPGMAGCGNSGDTQDYNIPGAGRMGGDKYDTSGGGGGGGGDYCGAFGQGGRTTGSRGYERDNDEYADPSSGGTGALSGAGGQGGKPSAGSKMMGGVEKLAGKLTRDSNLETKGEQRQGGQF
ncbi:hypothetical protein HYDPIDRAFT_40347 [Hydnomerulius pinastri MD-312]|uniref:Uncharacterized protein n=1 Tax=Hydnomerulius pinastri MD-312 TaxID=994086 RepID=A0A0C9WG10_9AGAM|nr:hypothetical protein HYDPIDRAFT_40347 [Hydnomerulius pinastri MD-312]